MCLILECSFPLPLCFSFRQIHCKYLYVTSLFWVEANWAFFLKEWLTEVVLWLNRKRQVVLKEGDPSYVPCCSHTFHLVSDQPHHLFFQTNFSINLFSILQATLTDLTELLSLTDVLVTRMLSELGSFLFKSSFQYCFFCKVFSLSSAVT